MTHNHPVEQELPLDQIDINPDNPRQHTDLEEDSKLTSSMSLHGLLQAILLIFVNGRYVILDGHRRFAAACKLGWKTIKVQILDQSHTSQIKTLMLILNLRRSDLNVMDRSDAFKAIQTEGGHNLSQLADAVSEDMGTVSKTLQLQALIPEARALVRAGQLGFVKAYELARLSAEKQEVRLRDGSVQGRRSGQTMNQTQQVTKRVMMPLGSGIAVTVTGPQLSMEDLLISLEFILKEGRKYKAKNVDVSTLGKLFQDQAKAGGKP